MREGYVERLEDRVPSGAEVVELGCGTGLPVAERLARRYRYVGVDISAEMVRPAEANVPQGRFRVADMRDVEFPAGSLGAVVAFYSIIHVTRRDQAGLFARIRSWLRPGGLFVACLTAGDLPGGWEDDWLGGGPMFWSGYDTDTNLGLLEEAGFEVVWSEVHTQMERETEERFLWVEAQRPQ
ncbi:MAG: class I SAM-dependent methyltransferase [Acidimicrobiia bacterium]